MDIEKYIIDNIIKDIENPIPRLELLLKQKKELIDKLIKRQYEVIETSGDCECCHHLYGNSEEGVDKIELRICYHKKLNKYIATYYYQGYEHGDIVRNDIDEYLESIKHETNYDDYLWFKEDKSKTEILIKDLKEDDIKLKGIFYKRLTYIIDKIKDYENKNKELNYEKYM